MVIGSIVINFYYCMKNFSIYILIFALLVMNVTAISHASCMIDASDPIHLTDNLLGDNNDPDIDQNDQCDCCSGSNCYHGFFVSFPNQTNNHFDVSSIYISWDEMNYLSHLQYPPSKPPKT